MVKTVVAAVAAGVLASTGAMAPGGPDPQPCAGPRHVRADDVTKVEGSPLQGGRSAFVFTVTSTGCWPATTLNYEVAMIDSAGPSDVQTGLGSITFALHDKSPRTILVPVTPDAYPEYDEVFALWLTEPQVPGLVIDDCLGVGTILNDDFGVVLEPKIAPRLHCAE
ncbi:MAG TPA: hypothetical protein VGP16_29435 [Asanoa sp.]|jgi:hypothetical protein|nr:hypothetical protein [Asanoa sp.]